MLEETIALDIHISKAYARELPKDELYRDIHQPTRRNVTLRWIHCEIHLAGYQFER
jgi:hypothetical protein